MRIPAAIGAIGLTVLLAQPVAAQVRECSAFRSGPDWAVRHLISVNAGGAALDTQTTTTFTLPIPDADGERFKVNWDLGRMAQSAKGVVVMELGRPAQGEALGKITVGGPGYIDPVAVSMAAFSGQPVPVLKHRLILRAAGSTVPIWEAEAPLIPTPAALESGQSETAVISLGATKAGSGVLTDARRARDIIERLGGGGAVEIQVVDEGRAVRAGGFQISAAQAGNAQAGAAAARAEAEKKLSEGRCIAR